MSEEWRRWRVPELVIPLPAVEGGFVYFARCLHGDGNVKIGITKDLVGRIVSLRNGCPYPIDYIAFFFTNGPRRFERELHAKFAHARLGRRTEWFRPDEEILRLAAEVARLHQRALYDLLTEAA